MSSNAQSRNESSGWGKFLFVVGFILFVLAFVTFNLGLLVSFTVKQLLWGGLTTAQVWVSGVVISVLLYGLIYVQLSPTRRRTDDSEGTPLPFSSRVRRAFRFYIGLNAVAFVGELVIYYGYGSKFLRSFFTTVFPLFTG